VTDEAGIVAEGAGSGARGLAAAMAHARRFDLTLATAIVVFDQVTKLIVRELLPLHTSVSVIPGLLDFTHVRNTGAAFGFLNAADFPFKSTLITVGAALALVAIAIYAMRLAEHERIARLGLSLILGGAIGNLIDRAVQGHVVDFVDVYWGAHHFWAFNVADSAITVGAALVILDMIGIRGHASKAV
jgi:signal peptidase II